MKKPANGVTQGVTIPFPPNVRLNDPSLLGNFHAAEPQHELIQAVPDHDGFTATMRVCEELGLDLSQVPPAILQIFYTSGVCFGPSDRMPAEARALWRNSVVWPIKSEKSAKDQFSVVMSLVDKKGEAPTEKPTNDT